MPAKSRKQRRFFGVVEAYLNGRIKNPSPSVVRAAETMDREDIRHFASTPHDGLEEKASEFILKRAWKETPVTIRNRLASYSFDSIKDAAEYLASLGVLDMSDVEKALEDREPMINGFAIYYGEGKSAELVEVDPYRRRNRMRRALSVHNGISDPEDTEEERRKAEEESRKRIANGLDNVEQKKEMVGDAIDVIARLLMDE